VHTPDVSALQLCAWWGTINRMRDDLIYQAHLAGNPKKEIADAIGLNVSTVANAINRKNGLI